MIFRAGLKADSQHDKNGASRHGGSVFAALVGKEAALKLAARTKIFANEGKKEREKGMKLGMKERKKRKKGGRKFV